MRKEKYIYFVKDNVYRIKINLIKMRKNFL